MCQYSRFSKIRSQISLKFSLNFASAIVEKFRKFHGIKISWEFCKLLKPLPCTWLVATYVQKIRSLNLRSCLRYIIRGV